MSEVMHMVRLILTVSKMGFLSRSCALVIKHSYQKVVLILQETEVT